MQAPTGFVSSDAVIASSWNTIPVTVRQRYPSTAATNPDHSPDAADIGTPWSHCAHPVWMTETTTAPIQDAEWREQLIVTRELPTAAERTAFYRRVRSGEFVPIVRGVYLAADAWTELDRHARYRTIVRAVALLNENALFSHHSAAAMWRLPWVGSWPGRAHILVPARRGGHSTRAVLRHTRGLPDEHERINGLAVTTLARTVADVASVASFSQSVTVADAALRRTTHPHTALPRTSLTHDDLRAELEQLSPTHGRAKARAAIEFASGLADRPGESMSRVSMLRARLAMPELQVRLKGSSGRVWTVDFWWPESNLIGEFDGKWKYTDPEFMNGRTPHQVLLDEKDREDDLRAARHGLVRWDWAVAISPARLRERLRLAGLAGSAARSPRQSHDGTCVP